MPAVHIDAFCDFAGTGGTFAGCAAAFKEANPSTRCFVVEPEGAAALAGEPVTNPGHRIQGGGYAMTRLELLRPEHVDGYIQVSDTAAIEAAPRTRPQGRNLRRFPRREPDCRSPAPRGSVPGRDRGNPRLRLRPEVPQY